MKGCRWLVSDRAKLHPARLFIIPFVLCMISAGFPLFGDDRYGLSNLMYDLSATVGVSRRYDVIKIFNHINPGLPSPEREDAN